MNRVEPGRREALLLLAGLGIFLGNFSHGFGWQTPHLPGTQVPQEPDEALQRIMAGNTKFASGKVRHPHESAAWRTGLTKEQHPIATILGWSDSRVPVEIVFDQGLGDLFVVRVAGNVVDVDVVGSVEYAVIHLHTPLVLVLGHEQCGAVTAAVQERANREKESEGIQKLVDQIEPVIAKVDSKLSIEEQVKAGVEANVRQSAQILSALPELAKPIQAKSLKIVASVYELQTGRVRILSR
jgi:carbonic anhydrase